MDKKKWVTELAKIVGVGNVLSTREDLIVYECDGHTIDKAPPDVVVFPTSTQQVVDIVKFAYREKIPFVGRGAGTGLSGGALSLQGGIVIEFCKMNRILEIDYENKRAVVEPGVVNLHLSEALSEQGYYYVPDPSSQASCTIGGNIAENSGGPHTLKYGVTTNHVLGLEVVLPDGEVIQVGGKMEDPLGYDLTGILVGSEGTFGLVTKAIVRIMHKPEAVKTLLGIFDTVDDASSTVSGIIARGIIPGALEMMDNLVIQAVEAATQIGYPLDAGAVLIIELDGFKEGMEELADQIIQVCKENRVREVRVARSEEERAIIWKGRKGAFSAIGRLSPTYYTQDGVIPRTRLPEVLRKIAEISQKYGLRIPNVFHAGDGNLHPLILFDLRDKKQVEKALEAGREILKVCVDVGGSITGEHGIGVEKNNYMPWIFTPEDLEAMRRVKTVFNPDNLLNPGKVFPTSKGCSAEARFYGKVA
ncbi:MAG TPA: FAD-linked oxidase C-terminal domain-containing protein [Candidatus Limnocylindrales bacterium]|nr:FAD-linked oxidase C-terminal domain-containing protein [Candidatus Limnocylindrales bacterium]